MKRYAYDIEANSLLNEKIVDYTSFPYKLRTAVTPQEHEEGKRVATFHCAWVINVDNKKERWGFRPGEGHKLVEKLKEADVIVSQNGIDFDHLWLRLMFGANYKLSEHPNSWDDFCGKSVRIYDTMILSKLLNPDRKGGHSLKAWGRALKNDKIHYGSDDDEIDCWEEFDEAMYVYCEQDVSLTVDVFHALMREAGSEEDWQEYWEKAYRLEQALRELITRQAHFGFSFDKEKAKNTVEDLNRLLAECEAECEPHLPPKVLSKSKQPKFPAKPFLMSGAISGTGKKWVARLGLEDAPEEVQKKALQDKIMVELTEPMKLSSQEDVKSYLVSLGWRPIKWNERDLFTESDKKTPSTDEQYQKRIIKYVDKTVGSPFEEFRVRQLGISLDFYNTIQDIRERKKYVWLYLRKKWDDPDCRKVMSYTLPKFVVDSDKNLCPNLERLSEQVPYSRAIVNWLTYRHRRNSIASPKGTGWITQMRESDGRIPTPADTLGCNTARFRHIGVNCSSDVKPQP